MITTLEYIPGKTFVHRLDPRTKLLILVAVVLLTIVIDDLRLMIVLFASSLIYYAASRLPWARTRRAWLLSLLLAVVIIGLINGILIGSGERRFPTEHIAWRSPAIDLPRLGTVQRVLTWEWVVLTLVRMLRPLSIVAAVLPFVYTTDPRLYGAAFRQLGFSDSVAFALDLSLRMVPTLAQSFYTTLDAQKARGYEMNPPGGTLFTRIRRVAPLLVPVTLGAFLSAEDIADAMNLRAFGAGPRTWLFQLRFGRQDVWVLVIVAATVALVAGLRLATGFGSFWFPAE